ncbi:DsbA family protein [Oscillatoria sp. FACHB-1407]|uniref:DsbA family protein n=1 Tax=Oscillatoria sp. FACHB-1407 TaxID=2692847 RepID=UPI001685A355|nr:thioredoxin domain-containing protein [Oscillatoria sp. FACHB-1407]MBD2463492.1 DsbA family protein [Oscillatoria sp. FACHB-1407]
MSNDYKHHPLIVLPSTHDHIQGVLNSTVVLVMYGDYQDSRSADVYRLIKVIQHHVVSLGENFLCFVFRHFPQTQIHPQAQRAAEAVEAAAFQGQFWQMHDSLFTHQRMLGDGYLIEYANDLGLDTCQFLRDMCQHVHLDRIHQDIESGIQSGVIHTPTLFINGIRYCDRWTIERLMAAIFAPNN